MQKYLSNLKRNAGFTLIELLVVIGILGILAAALVATIDPFEQIKKATDSNTKNIAVEFNNAILRYYTTHTAYPWDPVASGGAGCNEEAVPDGLTTLSGEEGGTPSTFEDCIDALIADKELKTTFTQAAGSLAKIYVSFDDGTAETITCFQPESRSQQEVAYQNSNGDVVDAADKNCALVNGDVNTSSGCFWCTSETVGQ